MGSGTSRARRSRLCSWALALASAGACVCAPLTIPAGAWGGHDASAQTAVELATVEQINAVRAAHGLRPLTFSPGLFSSALLHDRQMVADGYFGHQGPAGGDFSVRVEDSYPPGDAVYYAIGENLFWSLSAPSGPQLVARWMASAEHRQNLLNPNWRQVAVAVLTVPSAPGVYHDRPVTVATVDFGVRR